MGNKLWGGRFRQDPDEALEAFNSSIGFDIRLYREEIAGSMAHCRGLEKAGILSQEEASQVIEALKQIELDIEQGRYQDLDQYEDIHHLVERALVEKIGEVGEKLHTARSRNDQVALDVRLYVRAQTKEVLSLIKGIQKELVIQAEANLDLILPGYTHLQRAQPVLLAHHLLGYYEMFRRDGARFEDGLKRVNVLPLGSGALAGTTFELDRRLVARELGFSEVSRNSMDAVSDRDFVLEFLFCSAMTMMHLSRLSEEIVLWATQEFGFVTIPDALATGSSIMPQKKNPDIPELVRGKTGRVYGNLMALLSTMK
ncbi:MAG TPA: argininosuccinate lyase, partial [Desulfobacterales bacterium]|nr:argininosuccinate lyase [Desulfobacterales bacterium]